MTVILTFNLPVTLTIKTCKKGNIIGEVKSRKDPGNVVKRMTTLQNSYADANIREWQMATRTAAYFLSLSWV